MIHHKKNIVKDGFILSSLVITLGYSGFINAQETSDQAQNATIKSLLERQPNNWGSWGENDEVGALNYLTQEQVKTSINSVVNGKVFTLQIPMIHGSGPVFPGRTATMHFMSQDESSFIAGKMDPLPGGVKFSDDVAFMYLQGTTHVDALGHAWYGDQVYGGKSTESTFGGHSHADISALGNKGIVGRGVLLDVGRQSGTETNYQLSPGTCITLEDLRGTAESQNTEIRKRDILLIRTGSIQRYYDDQADPAWSAMSEPGLCYSEELVEWIRDMEIPVIAADNLGVEKVVQEIDGEPMLIPLHGALIRDLGVVLSEIYWLEDLAADSAEDGVYSFMFIASPLKMEGGTGSPVNPIAIK
ncbi:Secreted metal-dependent enzyme of cyclase family [Halomonas sp. A3H3]|uniref:cyclase family protein n=1 Tax=Halomonas sp. A3H3 TaxID=1346287 RepID=UPI00038C9BD5|nr:cyclase family protein [Halomonas sp. A3H3]CDG51713.1 Secreted metal-dependent enzyme of cyclase family [Halomonas sp. A3H3]